MSRMARGLPLRLSPRRTRLSHAAGCPRTRARRISPIGWRDETAAVRPVVLTRCAAAPASSWRLQERPAAVHDDLHRACTAPLGRAEPRLRRLVTKGFDFGCAEADGVGTQVRVQLRAVLLRRCVQGVLGARPVPRHLHRRRGARRHARHSRRMCSCRDGEKQPIVLSEADWRQQFMPKGRQSRHQAQPGLMPTDDRF